MKYILDGLDCANCAMKIENELKKTEGLEGIKLNFATRSLELPPEFLEKACTIVDRIEPGVKLIPAANEGELHESSSFFNEKKRLLLAGFIFMVGLIFNKPLHQTPYSWMEYFVLLPSYLLVGWPVLARAYQKIIRGQLFDENFLMAIATIGAIAIHQLAEAVGVMLFYAVGEYYQEKAVGRSRRSIKALLDIQPEYANLLEDNGTRQVKPDEVQTGQMILIKPGERVPLDGKVVEGESWVDTSALTGESIPRQIKPGDRILAGMINNDGLLTAQVTAIYSDSSVARILDLVEKAGERKAPAEQFITIFAHYYSPLVVVLAVLTALIPPLLIPGATFDQWVYRALVLLVISCPCALMVSIPLGYFGGVGGASRHGILVKGANFLDVMARLHTVVFDKTGTLTKGEFRVTEVVPKNGYSNAELLAIAAAAEVYSNHPIAQSIREAYGQAISTETITEYREIPAHGISALVDGKRVLAGNDRLMHSEGIAHQDCQVEGTIVYLAINSTYAGYLIIADGIKEDAGQAIADLRSLGVQKIYMLTGDDGAVARDVASKLGLDGYYAELLPQDKVTQIETLLSAIPRPAREKLAFVGDGVNDAPVITRADLGVAMGALGSPAAIAAADLVLMDDRPSKLAAGLKLARRTRRIVYQNIYIALGVKLFFIVLGSMGLAGIWEAVFADVGVTLLAVLNATRTLQRNVV